MEEEVLEQERKIVACVTFNGFREYIYDDMDQYDVRELNN